MSIDQPKGMYPEPIIYPPIESTLDFEVSGSEESGEGPKFRIDLINASRRGENEKMSDVIMRHKDELCTREELESVAAWLTGSLEPLQERIRQHLRFMWGKPESDSQYGTKYIQLVIHGMSASVEESYFGEHPKGANWMQQDRKWGGQSALLFPKK